MTNQRTGFILIEIGVVLAIGFILILCLVPAARQIQKVSSPEYRLIRAANRMVGRWSTVAMKLVRVLGDFLFGVLLISGVPMCVMALTLILALLYESQFHVFISISDGIGTIIFGVMCIAAFAYVIRFRLRRRLLPKGVVVLEVLLGIIGAFFLFCGYGVLMVYSI